MRKIISLFLMTSCFALANCANKTNGFDRDIAVTDIQLGSGDFEHANKKLTVMNLDHPNNPDVLLRLAEVNRAAGRQLAAIEFYKKTLKLNPASRDAWMGLSKIYLKSKPAAALEILENLSKLYPNDPQVIDDYGVALDLNGRYEEAQNTYKRAISIDPSMISPEINLGLSLGLSGQVLQGLAIIRPYAAASDATPRTKENYALLLLANGQPEEAPLLLESYLPRKDVNDTLMKLSDFWGGRAELKRARAMRGECCTKP